MQRAQEKKKNNVLYWKPCSITPGSIWNGVRRRARRKGLHLFTLPKKLRSKQICSYYNRTKKLNATHYSTGCSQANISFGATSEKRQKFAPGKKRPGSVKAFLSPRKTDILLQTLLHPSMKTSTGQVPLYYAIEKKNGGHIVQFTELPWLCCVHCVSALELKAVCASTMHSGSVEKWCTLRNT